MPAEQIGTATDPHRLMLHMCEGCRIVVCRSDDGWRTSKGWVYVCGGCFARHDSKAARGAAVERIEGLR